jgi:CheY-like chemotaxis protein
MKDNAGARLNVLVVDDDHSEMALIGMAIEHSPHNMWLLTASDGQRAIEYLEGRDSFGDRALHPLPDLIVLDLDMALSGGFDFLDWRSASRSFSSIPVAVMSGWAYPGAIEAALSMGANASISKPGQHQDWQTVVDRMWDIGLANYREAAHEGI